MIDALAAALRERYARGENDYWMRPLVSAGGGRVRAGDLLLFCCRRGDRETQLAEALVAAELPQFERRRLVGLDLLPLVEYDPRLALEPLVPPLRPDNTLGEVLTASGVRQLAVSESEKQIPVTYFFNGRRSASLPLQEARIIASPHDPAAHPGMGSAEVGEAAARGIADHELVVVNFCAGDVVGHLRDFDAKIAAVTAVDAALATVVHAAAGQGATVLVTADHGLIERGLGPDGGPAAEHTANPVPFAAACAGLRSEDLLRRAGTLADVAPTVLQLFGLHVPRQMTGTPLLAGRLRSPKVVLVILDGWGIGVEDPRANPIAAAAPRHLGRLLAGHPRVSLAASGSAVGLAAGRSGNSEAGHLTLGAGRPIEQDDLRLQRAFADGFAGYPRLAATVRAAAGRGAVVHLLGLLSETSSHGTLSELLALAKLVHACAAAEVCVHLILDGRGDPAATLLDRHAGELAGLRVVTAIGRGYALDRSGDYSRTEVAYRALTEPAESPAAMPF